MTKVVKEKYHLPVVEEEMMVVVVVMRNQTKRSYSILNLVEKSLSLKVTLCKSKMKTEKGWWLNG